MESEHEHRDSDGLVVYPATTFGQGDYSTNGRNLSSLSSSSSASSSSRGPFELDDKDNDLLVSKGHDDDAPVSTIPWQEQHPSDHAHTLNSNNEAATQFPSTQVMERPAEPDHTASYRIPSSVFARTKSTAPMEWSVASNESLFSLHTGNMSFTRDQIYWLGKSGELGLPGDSTILSDPLIDFSSNQPPCSQISMNKSTAIGHGDEHFAVTEAKAAETMAEVIKEYEDERSKDKLLAKGAVHSSSFCRRSDASGASVKSFAFPILTEDSKSSHKRHPSSRLHSQPATPKVAEQQQQPTSVPQTPKPETPPSAVVPSAAQSRWFSCFSCCKHCS